MSKGTKDPFVQNVVDMKSIFHGSLGGEASPLSAEGWKRIIGNESLYKRAVNHVAKLIPDENNRGVFEQIAQNNYADDVKMSRGNFSSFEGLDSTSVNSNFLGALGPANLHTVVGFMARTQILDAVQAIKHDSPTMTMKFNLAGFTRGTDSKVYQLPGSIKDGSIKELARHTEVKPIAGSPDAPHVVEVTPTGGDARVMIQNGKIGNLLKEAGRDPMKYNLARNISVENILVTDTSETTPERFLIPVNVRAYEAVGRAERRQFTHDMDIQYTHSVGGEKTINVTVMGWIDIDGGKYSVSIAGGNADAVVTHYEFGDARIENPANEESTIRPVNRTETIQLSVEGRPRLAIPYIQEQIEDFNSYGDVDYITTMVNLASEGIQGIRETEFEDVYDRCDQQFDRLRLYDKLGGFGRRSTTHNLAAGGMSSSPDPWAWVRNGLKEKIRGLMNEVEENINVPSEVEHELFLYGRQKDVEWIFDTNYTQSVNAGNEAASQRYGFRLKGVAQYTDQFQRRVKVIGNSYSRMRGKPIVGMIKSNDLRSPFGVYFPYSFRVIPGRDPNFPMVDSLMIHQRDVMDFMASAQFRISLQNNEDNLWEKLTTNIGSQFVNP